MLQDKINAKRQTVAKHKRLLPGSRRLRHRWSDLEVGCVRCCGIAGKPEIPGMIRQISDVGVRTGLQINLIKPQLNSVRVLRGIPIQVRVKGSIVGWTARRPAHLERIISVSGIQIEATSQKHGTWLRRFVS